MSTPPQVVRRKHSRQSRRATQKRGARFEHIPAIDGLRGLAVVAVVAFHGEFGFAKGGFLGVTVFFTLSGFLITSLLLVEHESSGNINLATFWRRRFRRLLPAAWLTIVACVLVAASSESFTSRLRSDALASLTNVANWKVLIAGQSYSDLFSTPSPLLHFWSLAIEEQCYLLLPIVILTCLRRGSGNRSLLALVLASYVALATVATLLTSSTDVIYYGTHTRGAELALGALLAIVAARGPFRSSLEDSAASVSIVVRRLSYAAAIALLVLFATATVSGSIVRNGGLLGVAGLTCVLIAGGMIPTGMFQHVLSHPALRWIGQRSYGIYLFHWPAFVWLRSTHWNTGVRFVVGVIGATIAATISHRLYEEPLRRTEWPRMRAIVVGVTLAIAALVVALPLDSAATTFNEVAIDDRLAELTASTTVAELTTTAVTATAFTTTTLAAVSPATTVPPPVAPRMAVDGDSVAHSIAVPLAEWAANTGRATFAASSAVKGCGFTRTIARNFGPENQRNPPGCTTWVGRSANLLRNNDPDLVVLLTGMWDLLDARIPGGGDTWRTFGDPLYDRFVRDELSAVTDAYAASGACVVWLTTPDIADTNSSVVGPEGAGPGRFVYSGRGNERVRQLNLAIRDVVATHGSSRLVDLHVWMDDQFDDAELRPDGMHFDPATSSRVGAEFLGPAIAEQYESCREP